MNPSSTTQSPATPSTPTREQNSQPEFNKSGAPQTDAEKKAQADKAQAQNKNSSMKS